MLPFLVSLALFPLECAKALQHFIEIYLMSVEFRTIHADKLGSTSYGYATCATHTRSVHHDSIERYICRYFVLLGEETHKLHHDGRSYGEAFVYRLPLYDFFYALCDEPLFAVRSVICHDDNFIRAFAHFFLQYNQIFGATGQDCNNAVSCRLQCANNGKHRRYAYTAAGTNHGAKVFDMCCFSQRPHDICDTVACVELTKFGRRDAHLLHN